MFKSTTTALKKEFVRVRSGRFVALVFVTIGAVIGAYSSLLMMRLIDSAMARNMTEVKRLVFMVLVLELLSFVFEYCKIITSSRYFSKVMVNMRGLLLAKILRLDLLSYNRRSSSVYFSHLTNDADNIESSDIEARFTVTANILQVIVVILLLAYVNLKMLLMAIAVMSVFAVAAQLLGKLLEKPQRERSDLLMGYTAYIREMLSAFRLVKSNNLEERSYLEFDHKSREVQWKGYEIDRISTLITGAMDTLMYGSITGILLFVSWLATRGLVSAGYIVLVINSLGNIMFPVFESMEKLTMIKGIQAVWQHMQENLTDLTPARAEHFEYTNLQEGLGFEAVSFSYEEEAVLENVNLHFEKGGKYLLIGPSGGGKSTILRLIRKYVSPSKGVIEVDGRDLEEIHTEPYLARLSNIEQQVFLFDATLRDNLSLYKEYTPQQIDQAIEKAGLRDFVQKLPQGLNQMIVENGKNISGGEKARIAIARGLLRSADMILLDEAFAGLDDGVARRIEQELLHLKDVTVIQVSHVVFSESIEQYDKIYTIAGNASETSGA